jgi:hypothetical protein
MLASVEDATGVVVTLNVAVVPPAVTVTLCGVCAAAPSLARVTTAPPVGAGALRVTVPVDEVPPSTLVGLSVSETRVAGGAVTINVVV